MKKDLLKFNIALFLRAIMLLTPIMLLFYQENGLSVTELFLFQGIFYLVSILSEIPVGYLSDILPRKYMLLFSFALYMGIIAGWYTYSGYWVILLGEICFGVSKVMMDNAMSGYLYDYLNIRELACRMPKWWGYTNLSLSLGTAFAAIVGTYLFAHFGSKTVLMTNFIFMIIAFLLVANLPNIKLKNVRYDRVREFVTSAKSICKNSDIKYHILYSGILTSYSVFFALSFQPLMQMAAFPVMLFGVIAFSNHFIRALSGFLAGKFSFDIHKLILPLMVSYLTAFGLILVILNFSNKIMTLVFLILICLIIGLQVLFTILHVSRLHYFVTIENRGSLMMINNIVSRFFVALILISSKIFIQQIGFANFYLIAFVLFIMLNCYVLPRVYRV